jgi:SNF2 family DNA or RNA helicase
VERPIYHPAWHVPFQLDLAAQAYALERSALVADAGTGKTLVALCVACAAIAFGEADVVLVVCEQNKLLDWMEETAKAADLAPVLKYHGAKRDAKLAENPQMIVTTYETARSSLAAKPAGPLLRHLTGKRVVVVWDEAGAKLKNRGSGIYKAQAHLVQTLQKKPGLKVMALTATPMERDWESAFNVLRVTGPPGYMPLVKEFEEYIRGYDPYGRPRFHEHLMPQFAERAAPRVLRKRKTDADVREQFPPKSEIFERAEMHADQRRVYQGLEDLAWTPAGEYEPPPGLGMVLRQLAGHPRALLLGKSRMARLAAEMMPGTLRSCSSAKTDLLLARLGATLDGDLKSIVFTAFGQSVLPVIAEEARAAGMPVFVTHGKQTAAENQEQRRLWKEARGGAVLISSDNGARGVNLPEAAEVVEYESATTFATREQRFNRAHRLGGSAGVPLTCVTLTLEGTSETRLLERALDRNAQQDALLGDDSEEARADGYLTAADRKWMFACSRHRKGFADA